MSNVTWLEKHKHFEWMQKCLTCWKLCEEFISWCIENSTYLNSIGFGRDVSEICSQCIKFEAQRSPFFHQLCSVGADICEACAAELEKHDEPDKNAMINMAATSCRTFATACREIYEKQKGEMNVRIN